MSAPDPYARLAGWLMVALCCHSLLCALGVRFAHPELTQTQVLLDVGLWLVPGLACGALGMWLLESE